MLEVGRIAGLTLQSLALLLLPRRAIFYLGGSEMEDKNFVVMHFVFQNMILVPWGDAAPAPGAALPPEEGGTGGVCGYLFTPCSC